MINIFIYHKLKMKVITKISELRKEVKVLKKEGKTVGLVPTMGYLHDGHRSLLKKCREENDVVVTSNFVNPIQFGPNEDLDTYPRNFEKDCEICKEIGVDIVFHPEIAEMYNNPKVYVNILTLSDTLCGKSRPIHFKGVCTVVSKLFNIVMPDRAYFGQKDAQQLAIIKKMVKDLNFDIEIIGCPIVREEDGLAKSSRNKNLNVEERKAALCLHKSIEIGKNIIKKNLYVSELIKEMTSIIEKEPMAKIDYISVVKLEDMQPLEVINESVLVAMAVYIGNTRLIDNFIYEV